MSTIALDRRIVLRRPDPKLRGRIGRAVLWVTLAAQPVVSPSVILTVALAASVVSAVGFAWLGRRAGARVFWVLSALCGIEAAWVALLAFQPWLSDREALWVLAACRVASVLAYLARKR